MSHPYNRRAFLRHVLALSAAGVATGVAACGARPGPVQPTASATAAASPSASPWARAVPTAAPASTAAPTASAALTATLPSPPPPSPVAAEAAYLAVARGPGADPAEITRRAIAAVGGIERFVKPGADVIVKPNICNAYHGPEYASTTNPQVVAAVVALCLGAGAKRVRVMDFPFGGSAQQAYAVSGIADAVTAAGGEMVPMSQMRFRQTEIPAGRTIKRWSVYGDVLDADAVINIPIAKNHGSAGLTLGMKNLMGLIQDRGSFHARGLHQCIADLSSAVRPQLTLVDAVRLLAANGPTGGSLDDVRRLDTIIASADVVAADAYATTLFGLSGQDIGYIRLGNEMGLGRMDLAGLKVEEIAL